MRNPRKPNKEKLLLIGGCGYIGTYLYPRLKMAGFEVTVCDQIIRGNPLDIDVIKVDYSELPEDLLGDMGAVLWFGGHSSVDQSIQDPNGAVTNNCLNLFSFAKKLHQDTKFIYASTASLYSVKGKKVKPASESTDTGIPSQNPYDISKFAFDFLAKNFIENFYALRMGTLAGYSPNLRKELVFNAMNLSAVQNGEVKLKNSGCSRTILYLCDLWCLIEKLLTTKQHYGIFNVGSVSFTMSELAHEVAKKWGAQVLDEGISDSYSFLLDTSKMKAICGEYLNNQSFADYCSTFIDECRLAKVL